MARWMTSLLALACGGAPPEVLASGTNRHFQHSVESVAEPAAVWDLWTDVQRWPLWDTELSEAAADGALALGQTGTLVSNGRTVPFEIVSWNPPTDYAYAMPLPAGRLVVTRTLEPMPTGVRFTHDVHFVGFGGALLSPSLGRNFRRALPVVMEQLDALAVEAGDARM